ncbi:MAG: hypothetical protein ABI587_16165 [Gemmatimonadales bacterium]
MTDLSVRQLCERFWQLEREHGLLEQPVGGVRVWQLLRMVIYYRLARATGVFAEPHVEKEGLLDAVKAAGALMTAVTRNPLTGDYQRDTLVFDHARKPLVDGRHVDIYTKSLIEQLPPGSFDVLESLYLGRHLAPPEPYRRYLDAVTIGTFLYHHTHRVRFTDAERRWIRDVEAGILHLFDVSLALQPLFRREINHYRYCSNYYRRLLLKRRPRRIYLVVSYAFYKRPLIAVARELGIETIELQHGTMSPYHLGYSFPDSAAGLEHFPSTFHAFGEYWHTAARLPLPAEQIHTSGFPHFTQQRQQFKSVPRQMNQVLIISQGVIGARLAEFALALAQAQPDRRVVYKLHPGEVDGWRTRYPSLLAAAALPNVQVVESGAKPLYAWFAESGDLVGVFSTAIYEGLACGCRTFIVDLPGREYMQDLIDRRYVHLVGSVEEYVRLRDGAPLPMIDSEYFFATTPT